MNTKLTLVSLSSNGRKISCFAHLPDENGRAVMSPTLLAQLLRQIGCAQRGATYTMGA